MGPGFQQAVVTAILNIFNMRKFVTNDGGVVLIEPAEVQSVYQRESWRVNQASACVITTKTGGVFVVAEPFETVERWVQSTRWQTRLQQWSTVVGVLVVAACFVLVAIALIASHFKSLK